MDQEERIVWSLIAHRLGFHWRCVWEHRSNTMANEGMFVVVPQRSQNLQQCQDGYDWQLLRHARCASSPIAKP
ncbi:unnamed protein product [Prunus armeniaca]